MNRFIIIAFICLSNSIFAQLSNETKDVLKYILNRGNYKIYFETTTTGTMGEPMHTYVDSHLAPGGFYLPTDINLTPEEQIFLRKSFLEQGKVKLKKLDLINPQRITRDRSDYNTVTISTPVLLRNNTLAIYYSETRSGASFDVVKKIDKSWEFYSTLLVWIE